MDFSIRIEQGNIDQVGFFFFVESPMPRFGLDEILEQEFIYQQKERNEIGDESVVCKLYRNRCSN